MSDDLLVTPKGRKVPPELEAPVDLVLLDIAEFLRPWFHGVGFTPNGITVLSGILQFMGVWMLYRGNYLWAAALYLIGYMFDDMDGYYARYYDMTTQFGDMLDHVKDIMAHAALLAVALLSPSFPVLWKVAFVISSVVLQATSLMWMSCQEVYYDKRDEGPTFHLIKGLCTPNNAVPTMKRLRWFGTGTLMLNVAVFIAALHVLMPTSK